MKKPCSRFLSVALALACALSALTGRSSAESTKELRHLKGTVGYQQTPTSQLNPVSGSYVLPDDAFAVTQAKSAALLTLPDSSIVSFGQDTRVQVGAFNESAQGPGSTITINGGTLRFDVRRPQGATANYRFVTPSSTVAVRGTVGLLSLINGNTTVACLACAADSVTVTVGTQTFALVTGQVLTVSATGAVVTGTITSSVLSGFSSAGVSTSANTGIAAATAGVTSGAVPAAAVAGGAAAAAAGAAAGAAAAASAQATATPVSVPLQVQGHPGFPAPPMGGQRRAL